MSIIERANNLVNDYADLKLADIDSHEAVNIIDELLSELEKANKELDQYKQVVEAAKAYISTSYKSNPKEWGRTLDDLDKAISKAKI